MTNLAEGSDVSPSLLTDRGFGEMPDLPADSATGADELAGGELPQRLDLDGIQ